MEKISQLLKNVAEEHQVRILFACETGSRAWGFPSPDSDYDVRFIYMHETNWYLSLGQKKDTIEYVKDDWDVTGWDLRKSLLLLKRSNAPLIERFQSPMEYYAEEAFTTGFKELLEKYYSPMAVYYHHYSLARKFWELIKDKPQYRLKDFFYLLRSLLSCNWIIQDSNVVPMHLEGLLKYVSADVQVAIRSLVQKKNGVGEKYLHRDDGWQKEWVTSQFENIEKDKAKLSFCNEGMGGLNDFFIKILYETTHNRMGEGK